MTQAKPSPAELKAMGYRLADDIATIAEHHIAKGMERGAAIDKAVMMIGAGA